MWKNSIASFINNGHETIINDQKQQKKEEERKLKQTAEMKKIITPARFINNGYETMINEDSVLIKLQKNNTKKSIFENFHQKEKTNNNLKR